MRCSITGPLSSLGVIYGAAHALKSGKHCSGACELTIGYAGFNDTPPGLSRKQGECSSELRTKSLYICFQEYCTASGRQLWLNNKNETCMRLGNDTLPPFEIIRAYSPEDIANLRRLHTDEASRGSGSPPLHEVVIPDEAFFGTAFKTLDYAYFETDIHWAYGITLYYFWAFTISIGISIRLYSLIQGLRRQEWQAVPSQEIDTEGVSTLKRLSNLDRTYSLLKRYIIIPATFGYRCSQNVGWCTIPPRIQSLTIFAFIALNIIFCCISYRVFEGSLYWPTISAQLWRYVSDRTGVVSIANFPLIWLFGTRNNFLMWVTGWEFGAYNNFHRWAARIATVQAVIHSVGYTKLIIGDGGWNLFLKYLGKHYFWNGELATIFMVAICGFSVYGLRRRHYEVFLAIHILLSIIVLLTMYYHVFIFNGEYTIFIWPCLAVWLFDRSLRGTRILSFNWRFWNTKATATYDHSSNLVRLSVPYNRSLVVPKPGTYYYLYVFNDLLYAHQNHPFTLAYVSSPSEKNSENEIITHSSTPSRQHRPLPQRLSSTSSTESEALLGSASANQDETSLIFLIRPYDGLTSRLKKHALTQPKNLRILLEGPYGSTSPLSTFPTILFIVGGTGIAVPLSYLSGLLTDGDEKNVSKVRNIHIVWAVREHAFLVDVLSRDIPSHLLQDERLRLTVHVTQDAEFKDHILPAVQHQRAESRDSDTLGKVKTKAGRPEVEGAVREAVLDSEERDVDGRLAIIACGPAQMADQARRACVRVLKDGHRGVEYFEESFKW